jgi:hypothetical protein
MGQVVAGRILATDLYGFTRMKAKPFGGRARHSVRAELFALTDGVQGTARPTKSKKSAVKK